MWPLVERVTSSASINYKMSFMHKVVLDAKPKGSVPVMDHAIELGFEML
jgi:hypothetical protein